MSTVSILKIYSACTGNIEAVAIMKQQARKMLPGVETPGKYLRDIIFRCKGKHRF